MKIQHRFFVSLSKNEKLIAQHVYHAGIAIQLRDMLFGITPGETPALVRALRNAARGHAWNARAYLAESKFPVWLE